MKNYKGIPLRDPLARAPSSRLPARDGSITPLFSEQNKEHAIQESISTRVAQRELCRQTARLRSACAFQKCQRIFRPAPAAET